MPLRFTKRANEYETQMAYKVVQTPIPDLLILEPEQIRDQRGFFFESYNQNEFEKAVGQQRSFVQDNHSRSSRNVLRGLHFQIHKPQGKLVRVSSGRIFDVALDIRISKPTFGLWFSLELSAENLKQIWMPEGFAHGFLVLSDYAEVQYKTTDYWHPNHERCLLWNDPEVGIDWPSNIEPVLSHKDKNGQHLSVLKSML